MLELLSRLPSALILVLFAITANAQVSQKTPARAPANTVGKVGSGIFRGQRVNYLTIHNKMLLQGDIILEHVDQQLPSRVRNAAGTLDYLNYRWPLVGGVYQIPYMLDPASGDVANITDAISSYNALLAGVIQWVPYTNQVDYIDFDFTDTSGSGEGFSYIGRVGGKQIIGGATNCTVGTLLHEIGHATGLWHEQSRPDRDRFLTLNLQNMVSTEYYNSEKQFDDMQPSTLYDWSSIMQYFAWNFSKNGNPTMESIPAGMPLANTTGYSAADVDGIKRLYGAAPSQVTIATNPAGLQVSVDGTTVTTPKTYSWPLFSTHTLSVPSGVQNQAGVFQGSTTPTTFYFTYGRWNDDGAMTHSITVLPGNGEYAFPASRPAVTTYIASFVELVPYSAAAYPAGTGTITPSPAPQSYPGASGAYYVARQPVTLTATPNAGQNFYQFINSPYWVPGGLSGNPKTFLVPDTGNPVDVTTYFTPASSPIFTFDSNPDSSNFYVIVDGGYWPAPTSFSSYYNSAWNAGSMHTITVNSPEYPWTLNSRYAFSSWSDGGALSHTIAAPSASTVYTATLQPQYFLSEYANETCAGALGVTPASPTGDSYYPTGTNLTFTATPNSGWDFTQWQMDLGGTANPLSVTMSDEISAVADFNTIATPLTLASLSPAAAVAGSGPLTMTISGTGFTPGAAGTVVYVDNTQATPTYLNSNQITVPVTALDLAAPGGIQVFAENFPASATCAAYNALPFNVANSPIVSALPFALSFPPEIPGNTSVAKSVKFTNTGTSTVTLHSIATTPNFSQTNTCGSVLNAGKSCTVHVGFAPAFAGALTGSLILTDSAPDSPHTVALSGTADLPLSFGPTKLAFGTQAVGATSAAQTVTLTNNSTAATSLSWTISANYAINSTGTTCGASLAAKTKCALAITFTPSSNGSINGAVGVANGTAYSPQLIPLSGTGSGGGAPPLTFNPTTLTFPIQVAGTTSAVKTVTVKNASTSALTLNTLAASGDFTAAGGATTPCVAGMQLAAGATCKLAVTFLPALGATGTINGAVILTDTAAIYQQVIDVKGTAALPVTLAPAPLAFATQTVATTSAPLTVTLTNNLAAPITPAITGNGEFSVASGGTSPCGASLASHTSCSFTVTFTPSAVGIRAGTVTVTGSGTPGIQTLSANGAGK